LKSKLPKEPEEIPDYEPIRNSVLDRIEKETKATRKALHFVRRDLAMLACLCVAPEKGSPRSWAKTTLTVTQKRVGAFEVKLWDKVVETPGLALTPAGRSGAWRSADAGAGSEGVLTVGPRRNAFFWGLWAFARDLLSRGGGEGGVEERFFRSLAFQLSEHAG
jgi:hypothetical protein